MEIFEDSVCHMSLGERAAFDYFLGPIQPELATEIGTAEGAGMKRIAARARVAHSSDLVAASVELPPNVTLPTGDSSVELPRPLEKLAAEGRNVDFSQSTAITPKRTYAARASWSSWTASRATRSGRRRSGTCSGVASARFSSTPAGRCCQGTACRRTATAAVPLLAHMRDVLVAEDGDRMARRTGEMDELRAQVAEVSAEPALVHERARHEITRREASPRSISWRVMQPVRHAKARVKGISS